MQHFFHKIRIVMIMLTLIVVAGCDNLSLKPVQDESSYIFAMGTMFQVRVIDEDAKSVISEVEQLLFRCDDEISWRKEGSIPYVVNESHEVEGSDIRDMLIKGLEISKLSNGAFDMSVLPISRLWDFDKMEEPEFDLDSMDVPAHEEIEALLPCVDYRLIDYNEATDMLKTSEETQMELGAIGKGYAIDCAMSVLKAHDVHGGMISAGSSIGACGTKADGRTFKVALRDPRGEAQDYIGYIDAKDCMISTSGDYERYFEKDGVRYHHIIDPRTGYPADSGLMQVTIISDDSTIGDALSTACFVLGLDEGMKLAEKYQVLAVFVDENKKIWYNNSDVFELFEFSGEEAGYILQEYNQ